MKLPSKRSYSGTYMIGDYQWEVKRKKVFPDGWDNHVGLCDPAEQEILLLQSMNKVETLFCFIHEILHAVDEEYKIKLTHKQIYQLEEAIGNFLIANVFED